MFQSTPPREGRQRQGLVVSLLSCFNPRPHARGDRCCHADKLRIILFQSTPPREGRHNDEHIPFCVRKFQSTPPREGRRIGVTIYGSSTSFNPRPHARGDFPNVHTLCNICWFQSTPPREGRPDLLMQAIKGNNVSIHAPTRGATRQAKQPSKDLECFNPRPHARGDKDRVCPHFIVNVSIHAPTRGATSICHSSAMRLNVSIHAPTRGATALPMLNIHCQQSFNPRPHARGDSLCCSSCCVM